MCVLACVCVCVWNPSLMPSQCSIVPWTANSNLCKDSSHRRFCCSPFSFCRVNSSHLASLVPPPCTVKLCPSFTPSLPLSLLHASLALSASPPVFFFLSYLTVVPYWSRFLPPTLCGPSVSLLSPFHTMHSLDSFILCLVSCPPPLGWSDTTRCKKRERKTVNWFYSYSAIFREWGEKSIGECNGERRRHH